MFIIHQYLVQIILKAPFNYTCTGYDMLFFYARYKLIISCYDGGRISLITVLLAVFLFCVCITLFIVLCVIFVVAAVLFSHWLLSGLKDFKKY